MFSECVGMVMTVILAGSCFDVFASLCLILSRIISGRAGKLEFGWIAQANHANQTVKEVCDPDYGWLPGADGSNKCYMLIKGFDSA